MRWRTSATAGGRSWSGRVRVTPDIEQAPPPSEVVSGAVVGGTSVIVNESVVAAGGVVAVVEAASIESPEPHPVRASAAAAMAGSSLTRSPFSRRDPYPARPRSGFCAEARRGRSRLEREGHAGAVPGRSTSNWRRCGSSEPDRALCERLAVRILCAHEDDPHERAAAGHLGGLDEGAERPHRLAVDGELAAEDTADPGSFRGAAAMLAAHRVVGPWVRSTDAASFASSTDHSVSSQR